MNFVSNRDFVLATTAGVAIEFKRGVPTMVPRRAYQAAMTAGCIPEDEIPHEEKAANAPPDDPDVFEKVLNEALRALAARNQSTDFTGAGLPKVAAIQAITGWPVDKKVANEAWAKLKPTLAKE